MQTLLYGSFANKTANFAPLFVLFPQIFCKQNLCGSPVYFARRAPHKKIKDAQGVLYFFISSRTEVRGALSLSRTSFFPLREGRG